MNLKTIGKLFGLGVALAILALAAGNQGEFSLAQAECTVTLQPGESIQNAIDNVSPGAVICLSEGSWEENITIQKDLTLRGAGQDKSIVKAKEEYYPVIWIESDSEIEVTLEGLTAAEAKGTECADYPICPEGILVRGKAKATIKDSTVSGNKWGGLEVWGSANVSLQDSTVSGNGGGLSVGDSANVSLVNSTVSGNRGNGLCVYDSTNVSLVNSTVSGNGGHGLYVVGSAKVSLQNSTVSGNGYYHGLIVMQWAQVTLVNSTVSGNLVHGLWVKDSAKATIKGSTIENNGTFVHCAEAYVICNGILVSHNSQTTIIDSIIRNNTDWGVAANLKKCGYEYDVFTGDVTIINTQIYGNGQGNVCLP